MSSAKDERSDFGPRGPEGARWKIPGWDPAANENDFFRKLIEDAAEERRRYDARSRLEAVREVMRLIERRRDERRAAEEVYRPDFVLVGGVNDDWRRVAREAGAAAVHEKVEEEKKKNAWGITATVLLCYCVTLFTIISVWYNWGFWTALILSIVVALIGGLCATITDQSKDEKNPALFYFLGMTFGGCLLYSIIRIIFF
jgi:hypothetical protein